MSGFVGEWIVRIPDLVGPEDVGAADMRIRQCLEALAIRDVEILFDQSRWKGGDW